MGYNWSHSIKLIVSVHKYTVISFFNMLLWLLIFYSKFLHSNWLCKLIHFLSVFSGTIHGNLWIWNLSFIFPLDFTLMIIFEHLDLVLCLAMVFGVSLDYFADACHNLSCTILLSPWWMLHECSVAMPQCTLSKPFFWDAWFVVKSIILNTNTCMSIMAHLDCHE